MTTATAPSPAAATPATPAAASKPPRRRRSRRWIRAVAPFAVLFAIWAFTGVAHAIEEPDLDEPGTLDSTRCLSYWTQSPEAIPEPYREELGAQVYGCDICQDVCPWNRGIEKRRAGEEAPAGAEPVVSLLDWLRMPDEELGVRYGRLYFPRNDPRYLRRNALVAAGNSADRSLVDAVRPFAEGEDQLLREHAEWALALLEGDTDRPGGHER